MSVTTYDGAYSFKQDSLARLGPRDRQVMSDEQRKAFNNSPFMQKLQQTEDLAWNLTSERDKVRLKTDPSFKPADEDFSSPKTHGYDKAIDYYKVLGIDEYAPLEEVKKSYKKLSLIYHPDKTTGLSPDQKEEYAGIFIQLKNAYLTLNDNPTRRQYDRDRDRDKASFEVNGYKPKKRAQFDATEVLKKLQELQRPEGKKIDVAIKAKLEKFFYGGHKAVKRERQVKDGSGFTREFRLYRIDISKGISEPCECAFRQQGDHHKDTRPDTLIFKISSKPHDIVERKGDDLVVKAPVALGKDTLCEPYLTAQTPSVRGTHVLLWGQNPFFRAAGSGAGTLKVRVKGQGMTPAGSLHFTCRLGGSAPARPPAAAGSSFTAPCAPSSGSKARALATMADDGRVTVAVKHMQTGGKLYLKASESTTMGEIRSKIVEILGLPQGSTARLLQSFNGGYSPCPDKLALGDKRLLNCAGTSWKDVVLTAERSKQLLQEIIGAVETEAFQAAVVEARQVAAQSQPDADAMGMELYGSLAHILLEYGFEATLENLEKQVEAALGKVEKLPNAAYFAEKMGQLSGIRQPTPMESSPPPPGNDAGITFDGGRSGFKRFLKRHMLGPSSGFDSGSETDEEQPASAGAAGSSATAAGVRHGEGGLYGAPAMIRRVNKRLRQEPLCEVEFAPLGEPVTLFTRPTSTITFFSNPGQSLSGLELVPPMTLFAVSICSPPCAKRSASKEWQLLQARLVPVLQQTAFQLQRAAQAILPRAIADFPAFGPGDRSMPAEEDSCPVPWKRLGDEAFKRGDYFTAMNSYSRQLAAGAGEEEAVLLSNRAACLAKAGHFQQSLLDAQRALELRPRWGRAWSRLGHAASKLGLAPESTHACFKAVEFEPTAANVEALSRVVAEAQECSADAAHTEKEKGNTAMRANELGLAVAHYTSGIARVPRPTDSQGAADAAERPAEKDEHVFLRSVLHSNRAAALCRLRAWQAAVVDARRAVELKDDFAKAHSRLGTALLGGGYVEQAFIEFAKALKIDKEDQAALKGRQACLSLIPLWRSRPARQRFKDRFGMDLVRPRGTTKVYAISDVHFDHKINEDWGHRIDDFKFQDDVLIVAGNLTDTRNALSRALTTLKSKFRRVFYVPGNHELWLSPNEASKYPDSLSKLLGILEMCDDLGVDIFPAAVAQDVFVLPLLSWYHAGFDQHDPFPDPTAKFDQLCKWPIDAETQVWKYMLKLNEAHLRHPYHGTVISFSHFVPLQGLPISSFGKAAKAMGCEEIDEQVRSVSLRNRVHVYGHSQRKHAQYENGIMYVNHYHGEEGGKEEKAPVFLVYDGSRIVKKEVEIYDGPLRS